MQAEHFIYGLFNSTGSMRLIQSANVDKWLTEKSLAYLYKIGEYHQPQEEPIINNFQTEQVVTYTYLRLTHDKHGRASVWNHTILIRHADLFAAIDSRVAENFIREIETPPKNPLPPLTIKV